MSKTVVGLFDTLQEAQNVVQDLVSAGFVRSDISLVANDAEGRDPSDPNTADASQTTSTGDGVVRGAETGAVLGGLAGLVVGLGALAIPGLGPVIAAGPLAAALAGAGIGAVAGGLIGALVHQGVPEHEANYYAEGVRRGGTLVTVNAPDASAEKAVEIMHTHGAVDIDRRAELAGANANPANTSGTPSYSPEEIESARDRIDAAPIVMDTPNLSAYSGMGAISGGTRPITATDSGTDFSKVTPERYDEIGNQVSIPVIEEDLQVGKREARHSGVRIYTHATEQPVDMDRHAVDRPVTAIDLPAFKEGTIELTETKEEPVVSKQARVVEEVTINKNAQERLETVHDTVRRTHVDVDELNSGANLDEDRTLVSEPVVPHKDNWNV